MDLPQFSEKITAHYNLQLPFVLYSLPNQNKVTAMLQNTNELFSINELNENGFVLAPFDFTDDAHIIPEKESEVFETTIPNSAEKVSPIAITENEEEQAAYFKLVEKVIDSIKKRKAQKIVVSRKKEIPLTEFSVPTLLKELLGVFPSAFRYIWYHPQTGIWCGASPETLLQVENEAFKTMALAGTQPYTSRLPVIWGPKELDEQQLVTDAITNSLQQVTSVLKVSTAQTHQAGSLFHLKTEICGFLNNSKTTLLKIVRVLHPTPAVCGAPQKFAKQFILDHENYDRSFYTGFMGPIHNDGAKASLFVNLRCMQIENDTASIFVGGGITIGSKPFQEWRETQNKLQTMLQVLAPML